jgi:hypothetical protein
MEFVGGLTVTALAGMGVAAGTALTAVGCSGGGSGMCTGGLVTLPIGLVALVPGIWMIVDSKGVVHVTPMQAQAATAPAAAVIGDGRGSWLWREL